MAIEKSKREFIFVINTDKEMVEVTNSETKETCSVKLANLSPASKIQAALFGISRKVTNVTAPMKDNTNAERWDAITDAAKRLDTAGDWNGEKGETAGQFPILCAAMQRVYNDTPEKTEATVVKTMAKKGIDRNKAIRYWLETEKIALAVLEIRRERLAAKTSGKVADEDLAELRG